MLKRTLLLAIIVGITATTFAGGELPTAPQSNVEAQPVVVQESAAVGKGARVQNYFANRAKDLVSIVRVEIGTGPGIGLSGQITNGLSAGISNYDTKGTALYNSEMVQFDVTRKEGGVKVLDYTLGVVQPRDPGEIAIEAHAGVGFGFGVNIVKAKDFVIGFADF